MKYKKTGATCGVMAIIAIVINMNSGIRTNKEGLEIIGNAEGCQREPYYCPAGVLTDGMGNTHGVVPGTKKTDQQIASDWAKNIKQAEVCVMRSFNGADMNVNQFSAMTSAVFNIGCKGLLTYRNSKGQLQQTTISKMAREGQFTEMCNRLPDFNKAGGKVLNGLVIRRDKEKSLCLKSN